MVKKQIKKERSIPEIMTNVKQVLTTKHTECIRKISAKNAGDIKNVKMKIDLAQEQTQRATTDKLTAIERVIESAKSSIRTLEGSSTHGNAAKKKLSAARTSSGETIDGLVTKYKGSLKKEMEQLLNTSK